MKLTRILLYSFLFLFALIMFAPPATVLLNSMKSLAETIRGIWVLPGSYENAIKNWTAAFSALAIPIRNSIFMTSLGVAFSLFIGGMCAFALSRLKFRLRTPLYYLILVGMFIPYQTCLIPLFLMVKTLGLYDTIWGLVLAHTAFGIPFCTFTLRNFFVTVSHELQDAAYLDGCSNLGFFWRILLPLSKPALAAQATFQYIAIYNNLIFALVLTRTQAVETVPIAVFKLTGQYVVNWNVQAAGVLLGTLPTLIVFVLLNRYFVRGLMMGAVKG